MFTVVHVITRLELGGAQENTLASCEGLVERGHRVVLLFGPGGLLDEHAARTGAQLIPVNALGRAIFPLEDLRACSDMTATLQRLFEEHRRAGHDAEDFIVHTHSSKAGILGRLAAARARASSIVHSIHGFGFHRDQPEVLKRTLIASELLASRVTRGFVSVSRANLAEARARGIVRPHHHTRVIRSGMDLCAFRREAGRKDENRRSLRAPPGPLFVSIANLKPQKDPLTLVDAMRRVVDIEPQASLWYAGDGPMRREVEERIRALGLAKHFHLLGWRRDVPELISAADVIVLSSSFEGLPRSAVQAVATAGLSSELAWMVRPRSSARGSKAFWWSPPTPQRFRPRCFGPFAIHGLPHRRLRVDFAPGSSTS
ncbi:MAG: glycosyltransferase family 4 protein [Myxococcales bacterium]|nr:glycosyltransferase family 4 protein [Myxococcales bacterium]